MNSNNSSYFYVPSLAQYLATALNRHFLGDNELTEEEIVVRLEEPRFLSKFSYDNDYTLEDALAKSKIIIGDCIFYDVLWLDFEPDEGEKLGLFIEARDVIDYYTRSAAESIVAEHDGAWPYT